MHVTLKSCISHYDQFYDLDFVIAMFCWRPSLNKRNRKCAHLVAKASRARAKRIYGLRWLSILLISFKLGNEPYSSTIFLEFDFSRRREKSVTNS